MKKSMILIAVVCAFVAVGVSVGANDIEPEKATYLAAHPDQERGDGPAIRHLDEPIRTTAPKAGRAQGTITYDDGTMTAAPSTSSYSYGNRFNTWDGNPVTASGSVTAMSLFIASGAGSDNVFVSVFGPVNTTAGTAPFIDSNSVPLTAGSSAWNLAVLPTALNYTGSSFLAGVWYIAGDTVGLGSGTVGGQGHHGMMINDIVGTGYSALSGLNALVRASGDVLPVELMGFTIE